MGKNILLAVALSLIPISAQADFYCKNPAQISNLVAGECIDNAHAAEAAVLCLEKLEAAIQLAGQGVTSVAQNNANKIKEAQDGFQGNNADNNKFSMATLNALIQQANKAQAEISNYLNDSILAKPEDFNEPEITGMDEQTYLKTTPCYAENKQVIANVLEDIDFHLSDLELARDQSQALETGSSLNKGQLSNESPNKVLKSAAPKGSAQPSKKTKHKASDISGTEEEKNKK